MGFAFGVYVRALVDVDFWLVSYTDTRISRQAAIKEKICMGFFQ